MSKAVNKSILTSYLIGAPIGIMVIIATILVPSFLTGEGLLLIVLIETYGASIIGLVITFLIALWIGGKIVFESLNKGNTLILTSFKYSLFVNVIIWFTFCVIVLITAKEDVLLLVLLPVIAFIICTILTTLTLGILISYIVKRINN